MKKINLYMILFIFYVIFVSVGIPGKCYKQLKRSIRAVITNVCQGQFYSINNFTKDVEKILICRLSYHDKLMDLDSIKNNLLGTRIIKKDEGEIVKSNSGSLYLYAPRKVTDSEINEVILCIKKLKDITERNGTKFLYCIAPAKDKYCNGPRNIVKQKTDIHEKFILALQSSQIPILNFEKIIEDNNLKDERDIFYYTDHHWKAKLGFLASTAICEELSSLYDFSFNKEYTNLDNYNKIYYSNVFLGSYGKKVGTYFTWHGAEDFELIIPKFETNLIEEQPSKNQIRVGKFEDTVLFMDHMKKNYYHDTCYNTYSGGSVRFQIVRNNLISNNKKILLIRDSFANVVIPYLSLQIKELHICDMRNYNYYIGNKINAESYIKEIQPDYVIVLYCGFLSVNFSDGRYNFF